MDIKIFVAMKAFIVHNGKVLIIRESQKYKDGTQLEKWGFPGGRIVPGERFDDGLRREVKEETGLIITLGKPFFISEWRPIVRGEQWHIVATFLECFAATNMVVLSEDHEEFKWIDPKDYKKYNIIPTEVKAFESYLNS